MKFRVFTYIYIDLDIVNIKEFVNSTKFEELLKQNPISRSKITQNTFSIKLRIKLKKWIGLKLVLPFRQRKIIILSSPTTLQKQIMALSTVSDYRIGWFTESTSESILSSTSAQTNYYNNNNNPNVYNNYHSNYNNIHGYNNSYMNNNYNNYNSTYNNFNSTENVFNNNYDYNKKKLDDASFHNSKGNTNSKSNSDNSIPTTFETCWDIVNFIVNNYEKELILLTPMQFKYLLDIGLLTFNTNINLLVIDHCQSVQHNSAEYSFYSRIMDNYNENNGKDTSLTDEVNEEKDKNDNNQKARKKRRLDSGEQKPFCTRIVGVVDKIKENKRVNIDNLEKFFHCQMVWVDKESDLFLIPTDTHLPDAKKESNVDTQLVTKTEKMDSYLGKNGKDDSSNGQLIKKNIEEKLNINNINHFYSVFFSNETIINYYQCIDVNWSMYDDQVKVEQQKQKQKNPQDNFFHQQFKIPSILFSDMEKANINDRFKILLITYLKLMEFLVKKMSWLNDYKNLENTKRLIKLIKNEYKESGLWCACNLSRIYVESLYQTFYYHIIKEDYELLLKRHYKYTQYLLKHFDFDKLNNNQFLSPKVAALIECLYCHMKKINEKKDGYHYDSTIDNTTYRGIIVVNHLMGLKTLTEFLNEIPMLKEQGIHCGYLMEINNNYGTSHKTNYNQNQILQLFNKNKINTLIITRKMLQESLK
ncbi:hypothetical protein PIROE2DRAFT_6434 [Piromyces sp. E2]|nr:hypothetical protein PIROE2DRAFT_6434 [Piromyces sp. E2]|eukprot:OUM66388.1 hypothetical protein PIROE2DRAFT_6434 [Piromyces sp. E2]